MHVSLRDPWPFNCSEDGRSLNEPHSQSLLPSGIFSVFMLENVYISCSNLFSWHLGFNCYPSIYIDCLLWCMEIVFQNWSVPKFVFKLVFSYCISRPQVSVGTARQDQDFWQSSTQLLFSSSQLVFLLLYIHYWTLLYVFFLFFALFTVWILI